MAHARLLQIGMPQRFRHVPILGLDLHPIWADWFQLGKDRYGCHRLADPWSQSLARRDESQMPKPM
jgi:hypothetical protein